MKLKAAVKYQLWEARFSVLLFYSIIFAIIIFFSILSRFSNSAASGMEWTTSIFLFVAGIVTFSTEFKLYMQNGLSRKLLSQSMLVTFVLGCLIILAADALVPLICMMLKLDYTSATKQLFPNFGIVPRYFLHYCDLVFMSYAGYFIGALYYRMNKMLTIIVSIVAPIFLIILITGFNISIATEEAVVNINSLFTFIGQTPVHLGIFLLILAALFAFLSHLLTKKAYIK